MKIIAILTIILCSTMLFSQQKDKKSSKGLNIDNKEHVIFGVGVFATPMRKFDKPGENMFGSSVNFTLYGSLRYKGSELLLGPTKIYIPDNDLNRNETEINEGNLGMFYTYRYHFEGRNSKKFHTYFQLQTLIARYDYVEYSLGSNPIYHKRKLIEPSFGFGTAYRISNTFDVFASLNLGYAAVTANLGANYIFNR